jgi:hypothetical protein
MKKKLTEKQLRRFYRMLSVKMTDFDCGKHCAPKNNNVPHCCDREKVQPLLFKDEYDLHRKQGTFWRKMPIKTKADKKLVQDTCSYNVFAVCPGAQDCRRTLRAMVCRLFPFEPFIDDKGFVLGLVYIGDKNGDCALMGKPRRIYNPAYIRNCIRVWQELVDIFPEEKDMYVSESRKRKRRESRMGKTVRFFK